MLKERFKVVVAQEPAATATGNGNSVDRLGFGKVTFVVTVGAFTFTTANYTSFEMEESDDNSTFSAVDAASIKGTFPKVQKTTTASEVAKVEYLGKKRYVRCPQTKNGTNTAIVCVHAILGDPEVAPVE